MIEGFTDRARSKIVGHRWPGNVRELENAIERAVVLCEASSIDEGDLPVDVAPITQGTGADSRRDDGGNRKVCHLDDARSDQRIDEQAAEMLDISVRTIQYRLNEYGVAARQAQGR